MGKGHSIYDRMGSLLVHVAKCNVNRILPHRGYVPVSGVFKVGL